MNAVDHTYESAPPPAPPPPPFAGCAASGCGALVAALAIKECSDMLLLRCSAQSSESSAAASFEVWSS
jgi:hypothetical protein